MLWFWTGLAVAAPITGELRRGPASEVVEVLLELEPGVPAPELGREVARLGWDVEVATRGVVQLRVPRGQIGALAALPGVRQVRRPRVARPKGVVSEGVSLIGAEAWHAAGLTGAGQRIAILDVEFRGYESRIGTELPEPVHVSLRGNWDSGAHGTAVAEIVHDVAPEAELAFYSFNNEGQFLAAVDEIIAQGERIVSASIGFDNVWHADGTSVYAAAVDDFVAATGGLWFAAAGNEADMYWVGTVVDSNRDGWLEFEPGVDVLPIYGYGELWVTVRWDDPFGGSSNDIDLYLYERGASEPCAASEEEQAGREDPLEETWCTRGNRGEVALWDYSGTSVGRKVYVYSHYGVDWNWLTAVESLTLPADAVGATAVGAVEWNDLSLAYYSSQGPTNDGRLKPELVAPTTVSTDVWGKEGFPGTSSATPHVSGAAALLWEASPSAERGEILDQLLRSARDLGKAGPDNAFGHGLAELGAPPTADLDTGVGIGGGGGTGRGGLKDLAEACGCQAAPGASLGGSAGLLAVFLRRRRQRR